MTSPQIQLLHDTKAIVGESPAWDPRTDTLWWVDILASTVWKGDLDGTWDSFQVPEHVGAVLPASDPDDLLVVMRDGFYLRDGSGALAPLATPLAQSPALRFNDAKCDPRGRAFGGTMPYVSESGQAALYRLDEAREAIPVVSDMGLSNGLGWSPDGKRMYLTDSAKNLIYVYDYDVSRGTLDNGRPFIEIAAKDGMPDGLCVDDDGCIWVALWGSGLIRRYTPGGKLERELQLPVTQPTSLCFAGPDLSDLVITSGRYLLDEQQLAREPLAGGLFTFSPGCTGPAATPWSPTAPGKPALAT